MSEELYQQIVSNQYGYGKQILEIDGKTYYIQVPEGGIDKDTVFYIAGRGAGGIGDTKTTFEAAKGKNVVVIAPVNETQAEFLDSYKLAQQIVDKSLNADSLEINFSGHSNSSNYAIMAASEYCRETGSSTTVILNDPFGTSGGVLPSNYDFSPLSDSLIIDVTATGYSSWSVYGPTLKNAAASGVDVLLVKYHSGDHGAADDIAASLGTYNVYDLKLVGGNFTYTDHNGNPQNVEITYQILDADGNIRDISVEEAQRFMEEAIVRDVTSLYNNSKDLAEFASKYKGGSGNLASNMSFVANSLGTIRNGIELMPAATGSGASGGIMGSFYSANNYYSGVTNTILTTLASETDAIYAIADAIYKMDGFSAHLAEESLTSTDAGTLFNPSNSSEIEGLNARLGQSIDNMLNDSELGFYNAYKNPFVSGNVGKTSLSDLDEAMKSLATGLADDMQSAHQMKGYIDSLTAGIGPGNMLSGGVWDSVKANMETYSGLMQLRENSADYLLSVTKVAMELVRESITTGYSDINQSITGSVFAIEAESIDDTKLPYLIEELRGVKRTIQELQRKVDSMKSSQHDVDDYGEDEEGKPVVIGSHKEPSDAEIQAVQDKVDENQKLYDELEKIKTRIDNYVDACNKAQNMINEALEEIKGKYETAGNAIKNNQSFSTDFTLDFSAFGMTESEFNAYRDSFDTRYNEWKQQEEAAAAAAAEEEQKTDENPGTNGPGSNGPGNNGPATSGPGSPGPSTQKPDDKPDEKPDDDDDKKPDDDDDKDDDVVDPRNEEESELPPEKKPDEPSVQPMTTTPSGPARRGDPTIPSKSDTVVEDELVGPEYIENFDQPAIVEILDNDLEVEPDLPPVDIKPIDNPPVVDKVKSNNNGSIAKTIGVAAGLGLATGAAAYAANKMIKNKELEDGFKYEYEDDYASSDEEL